MANYANLLATIAANIYTNHNNEVTASMVKTAVDQMVASLGDGYQFAGVATPATDPGTPDEQVFYIAMEPGTYSNFGGAVVSVDGVAVLYGSGSSWSVSQAFPYIKAAFTNNGYLSIATGDPVGGPTYKCTGFIAVSEGQVVDALCYAGPTVAVIACYDSNQDYIASLSIPGGAGMTPATLVVPSGVAYVRMSGSASYNPSGRVWPEHPSFALRGELQSLSDNTATTEDVELLNYGRSIRLFPVTKLPCVSFQFDDVPSNDPVVVNLFDTKGLTCGFAFIASATNLTNKSAYYRGLTLRGYQVLSHSNTANSLVTPYYDYDSALAAIMDSKAGLNSKHIIANGFVCPNSTITPSFIPALKLAHAYAFTTADTNGDGIDRTDDLGDLHRFSMQSASLAECEAYIDDCIANDKMAVFYGHAAALIDEGDTSVWSLAKIEALLDYCIAKREAGLLYMGNTDECVKYFFDL